MGVILLKGFGIENCLKGKWIHIVITSVLSVLSVSIHSKNTIETNAVQGRYKGSGAFDE